MNFHRNEHCIQGGHFLENPWTSLNLLRVRKWSFKTVKIPENPWNSLKILELVYQKHMHFNQKNACICLDSGQINARVKQWIINGGFNLMQYQNITWLGISLGIQPTDQTIKHQKSSITSKTCKYVWDIDEWDLLYKSLLWLCIYGNMILSWFFILLMLILIVDIIPFTWLNWVELTWLL